MLGHASAAMTMDLYGHLIDRKGHDFAIRAMAGLPGVTLMIAGDGPREEQLRALAERLGITLPEDRDYATVAGLALAAFRRLPSEGETFVEQGWRFEVVDLDGRRIDKLLVSTAAEA